MATPKKPLSATRQAANSDKQDITLQGLQAEYQQRRRSQRPLPTSVAKAYEVLIAREEPNKGASNLGSN